MPDEAFDTPPIPSLLATPVLSDVLAIMTRAVFQAGVSWAQIAKRWNAYVAAFANFDVARVAAFTDVHIDAALQTPGVMRSPRKAAATVNNARALLAMERDHGSFHNYIVSLGEYATIEKDMRKRFKFMGEMNVWYVLFLANERVPQFEQWIPTIKGDHPRLREMVMQARAAGISPEHA